MFERFTKAARMVVLDAVGEAERKRAPEIGEEHLLLALKRQQGGTSAKILAGIPEEQVDEVYREAERTGGLSDADADALRELGIDVRAIVDRVENSFGEGALAQPRQPRRGRFLPGGHIPFSREAKSILERALTEARALRHRELRDDHLLLAIAAGGAVATELLAAHGLGYTEIRALLAKAS